jgi:hypothetical protein
MTDACSSGLSSLRILPALAWPGSERKKREERDDRVHHELQDFEKVKRLVKMLCLVNSSPNFTEQDLVAKAASELLQEDFGGRGKHARSSFGLAQIPMGSASKSN